MLIREPLDGAGKRLFAQESPAVTAARRFPAIAGVAPLARFAAAACFPADADEVTKQH
jgi:hypothetical protein